MSLTEQDLNEFKRYRLCLWVLQCRVINSRLEVATKLLARTIHKLGIPRALSLDPAPPCSRHCWDADIGGTLEVADILVENFLVEMVIVAIAKIEVFARK